MADQQRLARSADYDDQEESPSHSRRNLVSNFERVEKGFHLNKVDIKTNMNLLDWGKHNHIAIGSNDSIDLLDLNRYPEKGFLYTALSSGHPDNHISSLSWCSEGSDALAFGTAASIVHLADLSISQLIRTFDSRTVGSMAWNGRFLSTGSFDGSVVNYDLQVQREVSRVPEPHGGPICGLKWSASGQLLASGGWDNVVRVWDVRCMPAKSLHRFENHKAYVRALAWSPMKRHLLASGGGAGDIRLWDARTGTPHGNSASVYTGSEVQALHWCRHNPDVLLSAHGLGGSAEYDNMLTLWRSPSLFKIDQMFHDYNYEHRQHFGHEILGRPCGFFHSAQSPDGQQVAFTGNDDAIKCVDVFEEAPKPAAAPEPFSTYSRPNNYTHR